MLVFQQSEATAAQRRFPIFLVDATDGITPETGITGTPQVSKNGAAFGNTTNTITEVGNGFYYIELTAAELDTLGMVTVRFKDAATAEFNLTGKVVAFDPFDANLGLTNLDAAVSTRSSHAAADVAQVSLSELAQGAPPAAPTVEQALMLLYMAMRNAETQSATEYAITDDAGTVIAKAALSDDGSVVTKAEMVSGP